MNEVEPASIFVIERQIDNEWYPYGEYHHPDNYCVARAFLKDARTQYPKEKFRMYSFNRGTLHE